MQVKIETIKVRPTSLDEVKEGNIFCRTNPTDPNTYIQESLDLWYVVGKQNILPKLHEGKKYIVSVDGKIFLQRDLDISVFILITATLNSQLISETKILKQISTGTRFIFGGKDYFIVDLPQTSKKVADSTAIFCAETGEIITPDNDRLASLRSDYTITITT